MKLGVAYNIFDGEEMLVHSLKNLRPMVDYICVVYQTMSNYAKANTKLFPILRELQDDGLIDTLHSYFPTLHYDTSGKLLSNNGLINEIKKRNIGLDLCRAWDCDTFMTIDCDELYDEKQFLWAKEEFEKGKYDTSFTQMKTYYKYPTIELSPPETYYAPLFYKINSNTQFSFDYYNDKYPVNIDPTRRVKAGYTRVYTRDEIELYHYAYVRNDIRSKVNNSSSQSSDEHKELVCNHYENWKTIEDKAIFIGGKEYTLREVNNKFNIQI